MTDAPQRFEFAVTWRGICEGPDHARRWLDRFIYTNLSGATIVTSTIEPVVPVEDHEQDHGAAGHFDEPGSGGTNP